MTTLRNRKRGRTEVLERPEYGWIWKPLLVLLVLYLVICIGLGIWWSQRPDDFSVEQAVVEQRGQASSQPAARGSVTVASLMTAIETLLDKPGGYLRNDVAPPGVWLDNMPNWEYGVLHEARLMAQALPALSAENAGALQQAGEALATDSQDWLYPAAEKRYAKAVAVLEEYLANLSGQDASGFVDDGSGLAEWLHSLSARFGELTNRLSASVDDPDALRQLGVGEADLPDATPWFRIDNVFFEARGDAWAAMHLLQAVARDYSDVLAKAGVSGDVERMIAELELAQRRVWSPIILNGSGFGIFANHSLVLANHTLAVSELAGSLADSVADVAVEPAANAASKAAPAGDAQGGGSDRPAGKQAAPSKEPAPGQATGGEAGGAQSTGSGQQDTPSAQQDTQSAEQAPAPEASNAASPSANEPAGESLSSPPKVPATTPGSKS
ncbi:hypothetical protein SAMN05661010_02481 [Modicisalibacter muralis]|uniref:DUF2333 domain-containing protein n=1 Tax=Modicisalibacter muralis TaxID=119000 RepID=A0A1G9MRP6_9GAMM|nr:DUF2333 family protein [Halomonas muralis]SDL76587.1 hypothetical protein SAMN05661010_02481 [Halomonas muralis]